MAFLSVAVLPQIGRVTNWNWKNTLENKGLKVNIRMATVMVSGSEGELFKSKIDPCGVCGRPSHGQFSVV